MHIISPDNDTSPCNHNHQKSCPKCGLTRINNTECPGCGIVFLKYRNNRQSTKPINRKQENNDIPDRIDWWLGNTGKLLLTGLMSFLFFYMVINGSSWCFLDYVNLPFHEFGHIFFGPFGETIQFLGGTLSQLLWPCILFLYFFMRREMLSASFCLFWFGENFLNISKYTADARTMNLPLVGGGIHDWNFLLTRWNALQHDQTIAGVFYGIGVIVMAGSIGWAFFTTPRQGSR